MSQVVLHLLIFVRLTTFLTVTAWSGQIAAQSYEQASSCRPQGDLTQGRVRHVVDGDTVILSDGRSIRLLGINTPEIGHHDRPEEPLGDKARQRLTDLLLRHGNKIDFKIGQQPKDRYQRILAHLYVGDGFNVQADLLEQGLASNLVIPPNIEHQDCYIALQQLARRQNLGIWAHPYFKALDATSLSQEGHQGFKLIKGRVASVRFLRRVIWINFLGNHLAARIKRADLDYFQDLRLQDLQGKTIVAQGYVVSRKSKHEQFGSYILHLRHKDMIIAIE